MYFYSDKSPNTNFKGNVWELNGSYQYLKHYDNLMFLKFVANNTLASMAERNQAAHEIKICEKKLDFWKRHPNYDDHVVSNGIKEIKSRWSK